MNALTLSAWIRRSIPILFYEIAVLDVCPVRLETAPTGFGGLAADGDADSSFSEGHIENSRCGLLGWIPAEQIERCRLCGQIRLYPFHR